jgi:DNA-binding transcriptional ArsR family regulator
LYVRTVLVKRPLLEEDILFFTHQSQTMMMDSSTLENVSIVPAEVVNHAKMDNETTKKAALALRAVNHTMRRQIIRLLDKNKRMAVTDIYVTLRLEQAVASHHLGILRNQKIVIAERLGREIFYSVNYARIGEIVLFLNKLAHAAVAGN